MEEIIEYNGKPYACTKWNGEYYAECWECISFSCNYPKVENPPTITLAPIRKLNEETGDVEYIGWEEA